VGALLMQFHLLTSKIGMALILHNQFTISQNLFGTSDFCLSLFCHLTATNQPLATNQLTQRFALAEGLEQQ
jgi:hypothetical protein